MAKAHSENIDPELLDAAVRGGFGVGTAEERAQLEAWLEQHPSKRREWEELQSFWQMLGSMQVPADELRKAGRTRTRWSDRLAQSIREVSTLRWAAACTAVAVVTLGWILLAQQRGGAVVEVAEAMRGQSRSLVLADGSRVDLGADSRIEIQFGSSERRITMTKGEALFSVAKDTQRPFTVVTSVGSATALGTQFDVRFDTSDMKVTVVEGVVHVAAHDSEAGNGFEAADRSATIAAGEQVKVVARAASGKSMHFVERMGSVDPSLVASWRWGKLNFYGQPLAEAVVDVNRHSEQLRLEATGSASSIPVYGVFDVGDVRGFASAIRDRIATDAAVTGTVRLIEGPAPQ